jgi:hypothetical protein
LTYLKLTTVSELTCWEAKSAQRAASSRKAIFIFFLYKPQLLCGTNKKKRWCRRKTYPFFKTRPPLVSTVPNTVCTLTKKFWKILNNPNQPYFPFMVVVARQRYKVIKIFGDI